MISHNRLLRDTFVPSSELSTVPRIYDLSPFFFDIFEKASRGDRSITIHDIYYIYIYIYASLRERERKKNFYVPRGTIEAEHRSKYSTHVCIDRHRSASSIFPRLNAENPACLSLSPLGEYRGRFTNSITRFQHGGKMRRKRCFRSKGSRPWNNTFTFF